MSLSKRLTANEKVLAVQSKKMLINLRLVTAASRCRVVRTPSLLENNKEEEEEEEEEE